MILAIVDDLLFRSKLEAVAAQLGTPLTLAEDAGQALRPGSAWSRVLIDLNLSRGEALAMVRALRAAHPGLPVIGYCSHVQHDLQQHALEAGCTAVLPRSAFVQQLPALLAAER
jgi:DNA-binding NarL/FixJ family response regulator